MKQPVQKMMVLAALAGLAAPAHAALHIYEPFDYAQTEPINDGAWLGDGNQAGGLGLGTWSQLDNGSSTVDNEADVRDGGLSFTDTFSNVLPVAGNAWTRVNRVGQIATSSPIDNAATLGLTTDNTSMWMTFLFQDLGFSGPDFGIGMQTENMVGNDNQSLVAAGYGVGFGITSSGSANRSIHTVVYDNSTEFAKVNEPTPTFNGPGASAVVLLAMKVNWKPAGTPDEIFVFNISGNDITVEPSEATALASTTVDWDQPTQNALDVFNISDTQVANVDEIRVATTYLEAVGIPEPSSLALLGLGGLLIARRRR